MCIEKGKIMDDRIMVKLTASDQFIIFQTITRKQSKSRRFYVSRDDLLSLRTRGYLTARDGSFAVFYADEDADELRISFYWLSFTAHDIFKGEVQSVTLPFFDALAFMEHSASEEGQREWRTLSKPEMIRPYLTFSSSNSLKAVAGNKLVRRKLSKFLRNNFNWPRSTKVQFFGDSEPYSFFFREYRVDGSGICGGLILHGRENLDKAYYSIHT